MILKPSSGKAAKISLSVLVYLRRQDLFIESAWNQGIESNYIWYDIEEYCNSFSRATESTEYLRKIREIADVIGKENIIIRVYERGQLQGDKGDSISDFLEVLKEQGCILENERIIYPKRINTRLNDETLNYALMFNREYYKHAHATMPEIQELFGIMNENSAEQVYSAYLTKEDRVSILNKHREDNEILAKEYLQREDGKLFFDDRIDFPVWNPGQLSKDEERFIILLAQQFAKCSNRIEREKKEASRPLSLIKSFVKFFLNKS